jgi:hypothetical protein
MRSFYGFRVSIFSLACVAFMIFLSGCPGDDDDGSYVCGDGVCENSDGENEFNCSEDCASEDPCGDGFCRSSDGENAQNCAADCGQNGPVCGNGSCESGENSGNCPGDCSACTNPSYPVDCPGDNVCWTPGTNCSGYAFVCNGNNWRCGNNSSWANCCNNIFAECPAPFPFFCPADGVCYSSPPVGCPASCAYVAQDCGP